MTLQSLTPALQLSIRAASAAGMAVAVAQVLRLQFPLYALVAAVIVTDLSAAKTRQQSLPRLMGTILGAVLGAVINPLLPQDAWAVGAGVLMAMFVSHLVGHGDAAKVAGYVCGIVVLDHGEHPWDYAFHRTVETGLGIGASLLLSLLPLLIRTDPRGRPRP